MMVTFISQCEKKALKRTRRVLDSFANRIGDNTWQTVITNEGLGAVKKLLRKTATKNTAVSCHWIRSRSRSELVWVVGNRDKFNEQGIVPVNYTENKTDRFMDQGQWQTLEVIKYGAAIAGLFHDFGKVTVLFQDKINPDINTKRYEPYRHEWVSLRLFQAFIGDCSDLEWIDALSDIDKNLSLDIYRDGIDSGSSPKLDTMPPFAQLVAWLIATHHKLPIYPAWKEGQNSPPNLNDIDEWLSGKFNALWNSPACKDDDQKSRISDNWTFKELPFKSMQWRSRACDIASEARMVIQNETAKSQNWLHEQLFTTHLSRLCLILADHFYSSKKIDECEKKWRNPHYKVYANTDWLDEKKVYKQQLDEHLIGVAHYAGKIAGALSRLNNSLPTLEPGHELTGNVPKNKKANFGWQDNARKLAEKMGKQTVEHGFFGINMASTGKGKTRANAKIMAALGQQTGRVRFSVALGLRVLTLQTGKEFQNELKISDDDLAIAVGGISVKQLFEKQQESTNQISDGDETPEVMGSESSEEMLDPDIKVHYRGKAEEHSLHTWTKPQKRLDDLLLAPVLVSTIDHLIPATEGTKGGHHIPAMLRLLTSDLVLDEPDDYGLSDLPALCRLVNWAGMLGSRVLLSTATMPPALTFALFQAYQAGWSEYAKANLENWNGEICCAWFDERENNKGCMDGSYKEFEDFKKAHESYTEKRIDYLKSLDAKRKAKILEISNDTNKTVIQRMTDAIQEGILNLDKEHRGNNKTGAINDKTLSIGLVRMANIDPMVAVAKVLLEKEVPEDTCIYYCIYHSRYPLAIRSYIEQKLDKLLNRKKPETIWKQSEIEQALNENLEAQHHIFVVLASPVAEVGRDHDYDWAIVEPSSMRSIIQLAGRVLRHRDIIPNKTNILLLQKNKKALANKSICFNRPGFESAELNMAQHDLFDIMNKDQYEQITALHRIYLPPNYCEDKKCLKNLALFEQRALAVQLFNGEKSAKVWWKKHPHWCGEVQRQQRFRDSKKDEAYYLCLNSKYSREEWKWLNETLSPPEFGSADDKIKNDSWDAITSRNCFWFDLNAKLIYQQLAGDFNLDLSDVSRRFGEVRIIEFGKGTDEYNYHPCFGVYQDIGGKS